MLPILVGLYFGLHLLAFGLVLRVLFVLFEGLQDLLCLFAVHFRLLLGLVLLVLIIFLLLLLLLILLILLLLLILILILILVLILLLLLLLLQHLHCLNQVVAGLIVFGIGHEAVFVGSDSFVVLLLGIE